jgi:hypothetical protein
MVFQSLNQTALCKKIKVLKGIKGSCTSPLASLYPLYQHRSLFMSTAEKPNLAPRPPKAFHTICMEDVECVPIRWLWYPYIPAGKLTIIEGDPGIGKSWISCAIAKAVAGGEALPGQEGRPLAPPQKVLLCSAEDNPADTIGPRLRAMGAHVENIFYVDQTFTLNKEGIRGLEETMRDAAATIVFIDPIVAYMGSKVDMNAANEVRDIMTPLAQAADRTGCAIVIVRHLRKAASDKAIYQGIGSIDFTAAVRSVLAVTYARDGKTKLIRHIKHNTTEAGPSLSFEIERGTETLDAEGKPSGVWTSGAFKWGPVFAEDEYGPAKGINRTPKSSAKAQEFLVSFLKQGPKPALEVIRAAEAAGLSEATLKRAKQGLVVSDKELNQWVWRLTVPDNEVTMEN